jgi:hypothetical protein
MKPMPLMDKVHAWTFASKVGHTKVNPAMAEVQRTIRAKLRAAERFAVDDNAVRSVCFLNSELDRLEAWSALARLPHEPLWVEFDNFARLRAFEAMGISGEPIDPVASAALCGCLFYPDAAGSSRWVCQWFGDNDAARPSGPWPRSFAYVFDPDGDPQTPTRGSNFWDKPTLSLRKGFPRATLKLRALDGDGPPVMKDFDCDPEIVLAGIFYGNNVNAAPDWLSSRMAAIIDPWWEARHAALEVSNPQRWRELFLEAVEGESAEFWWILAMLAVINGLPSNAVAAPTRPGKHAVSMNQLPYFGFSTISLTVERDDEAIRLLDKAARRARHLRLHKVRGHWRVVDQRPVTYLCRHIPAIVEDRHAMCSRCERLLCWIEAHERGDSTLGVVDHDYEVTT